FEAEDGIRDDLVTGVQTCALPISHLTHLLLPLGCVRTCLPQLRDLGAFRIAARLQLLGFRNYGPAAPIQLAELVEPGDIAARRQAFGDLVQIGAEKSQIVHEAYASARRH